MPLMIIIISSSLNHGSNNIQHIHNRKSNGITTENLMRLHQEHLENFHFLNKYLWLLINIDLQMSYQFLQNISTQTSYYLNQYFTLRTSLQIPCLAICYIISIFCLKATFNFLLHCQPKTKSSCFYFPQHHLQIQKFYFLVPTLDHL